MNEKMLMVDYVDNVQVVYETRILKTGTGPARFRQEDRS